MTEKIIDEENEAVVRLFYALAVLDSGNQSYIIALRMLRRELPASQNKLCLAVLL